MFKKAFDDSVIMQEIYSNGRLKRYLLFIFGVFLQAFAFNLFILPTRLIFGINGIGIMIGHVFYVKPAYVMLISNILLLFASLVYLGIKTTSRSVVGAIFYPICIWFTSGIVSNIDLGQTEEVIVALSGAALYGLALGIIFRCNYTTGGTDIIKQIVSNERKISIGQATLYVEGIIAVLGAVIFGWQSFIYSVLALGIISFITDKVIIGISANKTFQIITTEEKEVKQFIINQLGHNVTIIDISKNGRKLLLCSIPTKEYVVLKEAVLKIDKKAFLIVTDTYEVIGGD